MQQISKMLFMFPLLNCLASFLFLVLRTQFYNTPEQQNIILVAVMIVSQLYVSYSSLYISELAYLYDCMRPFRGHPLFSWHYITANEVKCKTDDIQFLQ